MCVTTRPGPEILVAWGEIQFEALNTNIHVKHFLILSIRCIFSRQHNGAKSVKETSNPKLAQNRRVARLTTSIIKKAQGWQYILPGATSRTLELALPVVGGRRTKTSSP